MMEWNEDFKNKQSQAFRSFARRLEEEVGNEVV
jgi:hypothetical protein